MTCETALDRMLEADPGELRGDADTELARHIAGCARCRPVADAFLAELAAVDGALADFAADRDEGVVIGSPDPALPSAIGPARARPRWRTLGRGAWVPLAAAAALVAVLVLGRDRGVTPGPSLQSPLPQPRLSVTPPPDRSAAIMETENPNITIVWLYDREGSS